MPELPEVELVGRYLRPHLLGRCIRHVTTTAPSYFFLTPPTTLRRRLPGETIQALDRHGKYLLVQLSSGCSLLLHLGMTGQLILEGAASPRLYANERRRPSPLAGTAPISKSVRASSIRAARDGAARDGAAPAQRGPFVRDAHTHLALEFDDDGPTLFFRDTRKFGKVRLLQPQEIDPRLEKLGSDALKLTAAILFLASRKRRVKIKSLLLDQTVTAGIGNIYADESLFLAGIHPERSALSLTENECSALARVVRQVLRHSIAAGGSSIDDYIHPDGSDGGFQQLFRVYGREGLPCPRCKTAIERVVIGQRSSHYCGSCQR